MRDFEAIYIHGQSVCRGLSTREDFLAKRERLEQKKRSIERVNN